MPTYEYSCDQCEKNFDVVQSFHDEPLTSCPTCGSPVRKVFGNVGIVFKGSGFYKTDSRNGHSSKKDKEPAAASASGSDTSGTGGDDKGSSSGDSTSTSTNPPAPTTSSDSKSGSGTSEKPSKTPTP